MIMIAIFLVYFPIEGMGTCSENGHSQKNEMNCGYLFHCPLIADTIVTSMWILPFNGWLKLLPINLKKDEFPVTIFHPPRNGF